MIYLAQQVLTKIHWTDAATFWADQFIAAIASHEGWLVKSDDDPSNDIFSQLRRLNLFIWQRPFVIQG